MGQRDVELAGNRERVGHALTLALIALATLAAALAFDDPAHAISLKQADRIAMKVLKTKK